MSRILHPEDYKVSSTRELQEKVQKQKELEEKQHNALKEYQYQFGKIRGLTPESLESTTPKLEKSSTNCPSSLNETSSSTPFSACISRTTVENSCPSVAERMVSPDGVNRMLDFSEKRNSYNYHQAEERKPKLFQNLSFDVPLTREATAGQEGSIVSYKRNKREDSGGWY